MKRGDVVVVEFPYASGGSGKLRPAVVVQNNLDNGRLRNTVIAMITGTLKRSHEPTHLLIDPATPDGAPSGLHKVSVVNCTVLYTIEQRDLIATIGNLAPMQMQQLNTCLKAALDLP